MAESSLKSLRREIDDIDDAMHDLLMRRAELVTRIGARKGDGIVLRPGREARILRRLAERHRGAFPRAVMLRIWREIFAACSRVQGPFSIGVHMPEAGAGYVDLARDQYGSYTEAHVFRSYGQVLRAVTEGEVTVGVLALPEDGDDDPWWRSLMSEDAGSPRIVARLPFAGKRDEFGNKLEALAVAKTIVERTDDDRTYLAFEASSEMSRTRIRTAFASAGLDAVFVATWREKPDLPPRLFLAEVAGYVEADDPRVRRFRQAADETVLRVVRLGGYAVPLAEPAPGAGDRAGRQGKAS